MKCHLPRARVSVSKVFLLPVANLDRGCELSARPFSSWNKRKASLFMFLECSLSIAFSSRSVEDGENKGEMKNWEKRSRAPSRC